MIKEAWSGDMADAEDKLEGEEMNLYLSAAGKLLYHSAVLT